ncbi:glycoside hydrolase family 16 protein [Stereum hirsutum FP-91666 SS1]|uniref:glycoside hydrolase family 16 protein n=1 Tax=Stereum hirsutum (strain FP-91666) TaxID=721885 RepID=UPI000440D33B|nr:glycoside hydrolase family 16 protein [Stereum hirsutum FP-91666 SS1]EIM88603.1 glycoside hydrolase family 16 protein [Stereum hirsutum FP-91666 SS1]
MSSSPFLSGKEPQSAFTSSSSLVAGTPLFRSIGRDSTHSFSSETPYSHYASSGSGIAEKFSLSPDPSRWGTNLSPEFAEADDDMHNPSDLTDGKTSGSSFITMRGLTNLGCLVLLAIGIICLFAVYPILSFAGVVSSSSLNGYNLGLNASGQVPDIGNFGLIDNDTPAWAYTKTSWEDGTEMQLVFSDEFETDGRTFYPGDDPYWEAVDLHYWATNNLEWYDPAAVTTSNGSLVISLSEKAEHGLDYQGGMIQTWNKFCFTGGYIETSVILPGASNIVGLWPAVWTMGNLGRAGYGSTLDGTWPYTYDSCDVGTVANQSVNGVPAAASINGDTAVDGVLSYLPGQRLSRCTCPGESHPGPVHSDGTYVGRSAPEIDMFEAQVSDDSGQVSQSAQWAPFNAAYIWYNTTENEQIYNTTLSYQNTYSGGSTQQATSVVTTTDQNCYQENEMCYSVYGYEYKPGFDDAYITWISDNKTSWTLRAAGMAADTATEIAARPVPQEPMYILANLGMSYNFGSVDLADIIFPAKMYVDYIRVYQKPDSLNIGCDPTDFPTAAYINEYIEAYNNPNLTTWVDDFGQTVPKNSFLGEC